MNKDDLDDPHSVDEEVRGEEVQANVVRNRPKKNCLIRRSNVRYPKENSRTKQRTLYVNI